MHIETHTSLLASVPYHPSVHSDERPPGAVVDLLVIHNISLPPGEFGTGYIDALFTNTLSREHHPDCEALGIMGLQVSSHLLIDRQGVVTQYVPFDKRAWHAGISEFQGRKGCNDFAIGIELEGVDAECYTKEQYVTLVEVTRALMAHYPAITGDRIVGHSDIAPGRKTDPGPAFDWEHYLQGVLRKG